MVEKIVLHRKYETSELDLRMIGSGSNESSNCEVEDKALIRGEDAQSSVTR